MADIQQKEPTTRDIMHEAKMARWFTFMAFDCSVAINGVILAGSDPSLRSQTFGFCVAVIAVLFLILPASKIREESNNYKKSLSKDQT